MWGDISLWLICISLVMSGGEGSGTHSSALARKIPRTGSLWAAVRGVAKSRTRLSDFPFTFHFPLSCIGEGNGNPLQCSCLENPRDGRAWWAAVYRVAQSRTPLKRLSSSSSSKLNFCAPKLFFQMRRRRCFYILLCLKHSLKISIS